MKSYKLQEATEDSGIVAIDEDNRIICVCGTIDAQVASHIVTYILSVNEEDDMHESTTINYDRKPIQLHINSMGGYVYCMYSIIDIIESSMTQVNTYCDSVAYSAGFGIFLAGHNRYCYKYSKFLFHSCIGGANGPFIDIKEYADDMKKDVDVFVDYVSSKTHLSKKALYNATNNSKNLIYTADDAIKYGIVDGIIE